MMFSVKGTMDVYWQGQGHLMSTFIAIGKS